MTRILTPVSFWKPIITGPSFICKYTTTTSNEDIHLPYLADGIYSGIIDWGDGAISNNSYANRIHTYVTSGTHTITISGQIEGYNNAPYYGGDSTSASKLVEITQWGTIKISPSAAFQDCTSLILDNVTDILVLPVPNPGFGLSLVGMFVGCSSLVTCPYMDQWDMSNVENMEFMFAGCTNFNQPLNSWNMSNVYSTKAMFNGCSSFNQPLNDWDTSRVHTIEQMFGGCTNFNQPLNNWDVSQVYSVPLRYDYGFYAMFAECTNFNSSLSGWDVTGTNGAIFYGVGNNLSQMFEGCSSFNQPLNSWYTSGVSSTNFMFSGCSSFNQPLNSWNMGSNRYMYGMFAGCSDFNQSLNMWDVSNVENMSQMFMGCSDFNQPLNDWSFTYNYMDYMFYGCSSFNQPLNNWDTSAVATMTGMFQNCTVFNRDLSDWCVQYILTIPSNFATNTPAWTLPKPVWGTCPP